MTPGVFELGISKPGAERHEQWWEVDEVDGCRVRVGHISRSPLWSTSILWSVDDLPSERLASLKLVRNGTTSSGEGGRIMVRSGVFDRELTGIAACFALLHQYI